MSYPRIDENHSHCTGCSHAYRNIQLNDGLCDDCFPKESEKRELTLVQAEERVVTKGVNAATKLLSNLHAQGKSGASMPVVLEAFFTDLGGQDKFGQIAAKQMQQAVDDDESKLVQQWWELISRYQDRSDAQKSLDVSALEEGDLEAILADLGRKQIEDDPNLRRAILLMAIREDPKFRREAFEEAIKEDQSLVDRLLRQNGIDTVAGQVVSTTEAEPFEIEDYDPESEEL